MRFRATRDGGHLEKITVRVDQGWRATSFDHSPIAKRNHLVHFGQLRPTVGHDERGPALSQLVKRLLHGGLGLEIEIGCSHVQNDVFDDGAVNPRVSQLGLSDVVFRGCP